MTLADAEGLDSVTIRRLAQHFGVTPMALYWHVQNKEELLAAMGDRLFAGIDPAVDPALGWEDRLRTLMTRLVDGLRRHPASTPMAFPRVLACEDGLVLTETVLAVLSEGGFSVRQSADLATHALQTAISLVGGEPGAVLGLTDEERDALTEHKRAELAKLPADRFPHVRDAVYALTDCDDMQEYYDFGIELYLAGVRGLRAESLA